MTFTPAPTYHGPMITVTTLTTGAPDLLDLWLEDEQFAQDWADYFEEMYDPDCDPYLG